MKSTDVPRSFSNHPPNPKMLSPPGSLPAAAAANTGANHLLDSNNNTTSSTINEGKSRTSGPRSAPDSGNNNNSSSSSSSAAKKIGSKVSTKSTTLPLNSASPTLALLPSGGAPPYQLSAPYYLPNQPTRPAVYNRMVNPVLPTLLSSLPQASGRTTMVKSTIGFDRNRNIRTVVERAIREHKIFSCVGVYPAVRKALQKRGWVEKSPSLGIARSTNLENVMRELESRGFTEESDQAWMNRVLRDYPPDLIWVIRRDNIDWRSLHRDQIVNRFPRAFFTTKVGIAACLQSVQWFSEAGVSDTFFPRCYRLCVDEERAAFVDDFRLTACMGLLKWLVEAYERDGEEGVMDPGSRVTSLAVDFAVRQVNNYVRMRRHEDIDWLMPPAFMGQHWDVFLSQYYNVVLLKSKLTPNDSQDTAKPKYEAAKRALSRLAPYWPQLGIDGTKNVWICKPGARSRGKGIIIMNQLDKILELLAQSNHKEANWVVQKYIERPLIIYHTKFDIRQWFIVSDWNPLTVWFYKESYVRFCTKPFSLDDFHESIHLCNNAVQCRYQNSELRDTALPDENMWDCYTFQSYLKTLGKLDAWEKVIYPGMKQCIIGVLLASQETVDFRKNCFELYGADFMLSEDLRPWLIEINSCPCMAPSTSVTARMCAQCLEDTIKVIVDRREDREADTGLFEMIYKQTQSTIPMPFSGLELVVQGKKLTKEVDFPKGVRSGQKITGSVPSGLTFTDLVQRLRLKDAQGMAGSHMPVSALDNYTSRSINYAPGAVPSAALVPAAAWKLTSEDRINQNSIISVKRIDVPKNSSDHYTKLGNLNGTGPPGTALSHKSSDGDTSAGRVRDTSTESKGSLSTGLRAKTARNNKNSSKGTSSSSNYQTTASLGETLYSTLLQSSVSLQPTVADLARLAHKVHGGDRTTYEDLYNNTRLSLASSGQSSSKEIRGKKAKETGSRGSKSQNSQQQVSSPTPRPPASTAINGTIRPNARTTMNIPPRPALAQSNGGATSSSKKQAEGSVAVKSSSLKSGKISQSQLVRLIKNSMVSRARDKSTPSQVEEDAPDTLHHSPGITTGGSEGNNNNESDYRGTDTLSRESSASTRSSSRGSSSVDHVEIVIFIDPEEDCSDSNGPPSPVIDNSQELDTKFC